MESNEQIELTNKIEKDSDNRMIPKGRRGWRRLNKKEKGLTDMDNSVAVVVGRYEGTNGNGKNYNKNNFKIK